ncbi:hypothetical protein NDU88_004458 [Pleurodeles waltl]|uniref:Uncharacterized protein n=1 Tax=Pleurodeles waltl TaxID=8319 RepID=A0AAV7TUB1_PLEWA|nr:hypothetical protein NDU88_004458 [Pleurodeles waltl]
MLGLSKLKEAGQDPRHLRQGEILHKVSGGEQPSARPANQPQNQQDGGGGERSAERAARDTWLVPEPGDARDALLRRMIALGDARALLAPKNLSDRSRDRVGRRSSKQAVGGGLPL